MSRRILLALSAVLALCSFGAVGSAVAQEGGDCGEECAPAAQVPQIYTGDFETPYLQDALRHGQPFLCGAPANPRYKSPEIDCRIEATISVPVKVARYLGLHSRTLGHGVAAGMVDHYKDANDRDRGRAYFLDVTNSLAPKLKAKHVRGLGVTIKGKISIVGSPLIRCNDDRALHASCPIDTGKDALGWRAPDNALVCWPVMPWWVAIATKWGKMCPRPINA